MTHLTLVGNLVADPELRFTPTGQAVATFTVAHNTRQLDKEKGWVDGDTLYMRCTAWRQHAENIAQSLTKGSRIIATGRLRQRSFDTKAGEKRTVIELDVDDCGPALRGAVAVVTRTSGPAPEAQW